MPALLRTPLTTVDHAEGMPNVQPVRLTHESEAHPFHANQITFIGLVSIKNYKFGPLSKGKNINKMKMQIFWKSDNLSE